MHLRVVWWCLLLLLSGAASAEDFVYSVRPGEHLWGISERMLRSRGLWLRLQSLNQIENPYRIPPGTRIRIPLHWLKLDPDVARPLQMDGQSQLLRPDEQARLLTMDDELRVNDVLHVGEDSSVLLAFADGSEMLVRPNSQLQFDRITRVGGQAMVDTSMRLLQGAVEPAVTPRQSPSLKFDVHTPIGLTSVRGTQYRIAAEPGSLRVRAEVLKGEVVLVHDGAELAVVAGQGAVLSTPGSVPPRATELLPAVDVSGLPRQLRYLPLRLQMALPSGAQGMEVQISRSEDFSGIVSERSFADGEWRLGSLPDGHYWLRVRAIDPSGLRGFDAVHGFEVAARPEPPIVLSPTMDSRVRAMSIPAEWTRSADAASYRVRLWRQHPSGSEDLSEIMLTTPIIDQGEKSSQVKLGSHSAGRYVMSIATIDAAGREGPPSLPQSFRFEPAPTIGAAQSAFSARELILRWPAVPGVQRYAYQWGGDADFDQVILEGELHEPVLKLPRPRRGIYYFRVRVLDDPEFPAPFSATQEIVVPMSWHSAGGVAILLGILLL